MKVRILSVFLLLSSSFLVSTVFCEPHHHHNDFPWQNILSSLGIVIENQTSVTGDAAGSSKEHYSSESPVEILKSETTEGIETSVDTQNGITYTYDYYENSNSGLGVKIGVPIGSIVLNICFWYFCCKYCCGCCRKERSNVVVMQSTNVQTQQPAAAVAPPQIVIQQPIIHQQVAPPAQSHPQWNQPPPQGNPQWNQPPPQGNSQWNQPPPQGNPQWNQPPQGPPQWAPHPRGGQQQYSPHDGYDNAGFNPATAPPPYNNGKY